MEKRLWTIVIVGLLTLFGAGALGFYAGRTASLPGAVLSGNAARDSLNGKTVGCVTKVAHKHEPGESLEHRKLDDHGHGEYEDEGNSGHVEEASPNRGHDDDHENQTVRKHHGHKTSDVNQQESDEKSHDHRRHADKHDDCGEKVIRMPEHKIAESGIKIGIARTGTIHTNLTFPGEVVVNADRTAHIVPRLSGVVREVRKNLGDSVTAGEIMAVIDSRELAESKAKYLAALKRMELAQTNFTRFEALWKKETIPEKQFLEIKGSLDEAVIELRSAEQRLSAMGFSQKYLKVFPQFPDESLSRYEIVAPFDATVISKHITLGEMLKEDADAFEIADLSSVWVNLSVYQKDLPSVKEGQAVTVSTGNGIPDVQGHIVYLEPLVRDRIRAAIARVVLPNPDRKWRPGLFVKAQVTADSIDVPILIPRTGFQTLEGETYIFAYTDEGFEARAAKLGRSNGSHVEIVSGLVTGERYATEGTFVLKAALGKGDPHAGHGH
jgi:membrane fusion protein, heavy metal efflux system